MDTEKEIKKGESPILIGDIVISVIDHSKMRVVDLVDGEYLCKDICGRTFLMSPKSLRQANKDESNNFYKEQLQFIRSKIAPFLNYFHMRQLRKQLKDEQSIAEMDERLIRDEQSCLKNIDEIKKLW